MWYVKDFILTSQRLLAIHYLYSDIWIDCIVFMLLRLCDGVPVILPCHREIIFEILDLYMHENRTIVFWCLDAVVCYPEFSLSDKIQYLLSAVILLVHDDNSEQAIKIFKWSCSFCFINKSSCLPCLHHAMPIATSRGFPEKPGNTAASRSCDCLQSASLQTMWVWDCKLPLW